MPKKVEIEEANFDELSNEHLVHLYMLIKKELEDRGIEAGGFIKDNLNFEEYKHYILKKNENNEES